MEPWTWGREATDLLRLHLGCGNKILPDFVNVDIRDFPGVDVVHDLNEMPWPWGNNSCSEVIAKHIIEHLPVGLVKFMDECWRVLKPGGTVYIEVPDARDMDLAWADPTHVRPYRRHTFINYFTLSGVREFGYTDKPWSLMEIKSDGKVVVCHATPVKL